MNNFLLVYTGGGMPETEDEQEGQEQGEAEPVIAQVKAKVLALCAEHPVYR